mmetsp:Transcript_71230/g.161816  ORF Transcript_71230/g.161816 Transcript_71230/m.161816 type:complete len:274 (-) Transcript_71230:373-1194(-)
MISASVAPHILALEMVETATSTTGSSSKYCSMRVTNASLLCLTVALASPRSRHLETSLSSDASLKSRSTSSGQSALRMSALYDASLSWICLSLAIFTNCWAKSSSSTFTHWIRMTSRVQEMRQLFLSRHEISSGTAICFRACCERIVIRRTAPPEGVAPASFRRGPKSGMRSKASLRSDDTLHSLMARPMLPLVRTPSFRAFSYKVLKSSFRPNCAYRLIRIATSCSHGSTDRSFATCWMAPSKSAVAYFLPTASVIKLIKVWFVVSGSSPLM